MSQSNTEDINEWNHFKRITSDFYTSPAKFDSEDWITLSSIIGFTALSSITDKDVRDFSQRNLNTTSDDIFRIEKYYHAELMAASVLSMYIYGLADDNKGARRLALELTEATLLATSLTVIGKSLIGRGRPYKQEGQYYFSPINFDNDFMSFPSGHTMLAFAYSTVMANQVDNVFWDIGWYSLAGMVGYARIYHNQHWLSDVLMGAAIGYFAGEFVSNHPLNNKNSETISLKILPGGLALQVKF